MLLRDFDYSLPPELIAQNPAEPRDAARLLVYNRTTEKIEHAHVRDLPRFLPAQTTLVANNSRVRNSRLFAQEMNSGKLYEILILEKSDQSYRCLIRGKALAPGSILQVIISREDSTPTPLQGCVVGQENGPGIATFRISFTTDTTIPVEDLVQRYGHVPLPPYITATEAPAGRYQTVYAQSLGSAAAPTAGLHFTPELIAKLKAAGHTWQEVTLHVGMGTFLPLRESEVEENRLHAEVTSITPPAARELSKTIHEQQPLLAVGTTTLRTLESHWTGTELTAGEQVTDLFTYPGYHFQTANILLTNFHLPKSSLLMLVAAFLGNTPSRTPDLALSPSKMVERLQSIYAIAIAERYHFFSFGDAMLIL